VIVVADATPLHYLILIEHANVLPALYGRVIVPPAVIKELEHERTPDIVRRWLSDTPDWLDIRAPQQQLPAGMPLLGPGEREAIAVAAELSADVLLLDDRSARAEALRRGLTVLGTLRVLADAAEHGFADLQVAFDRLRQTNFRATEELLDQLLALDSKRRHL
jgi:predicted nucleic acid-binding protein